MGTMEPIGFAGGGRVPRFLPERLAAVGGPPARTLVAVCDSGGEAVHPPAMAAIGGDAPVVSGAGLEAYAVLRVIDGTAGCPRSPSEALDMVPVKPPARVADRVRGDFRQALAMIHRKPTPRP